MRRELGMSRPDKARLAAEILISYISARWYLRSRTLPEAVARLRAVPALADHAPGREAHHTPAGEEARLARAVGAALSRLPADSRCLVRSLVMLRLLARRGVPAELVIAAKPAPAEQLEAHAWIEVAGRAVLPPGDDAYGRLVTL